MVVVGHGATEIVKTIQAEAPQHLAIEFVEQSEPRGTGDAVAVALTGLSGSYGAADFDEGDVIVLPGDMPLLARSTLSSLVDGHRAERGRRHSAHGPAGSAERLLENRPRQRRTRGPHRRRA